MMKVLLLNIFLILFVAASASVPLDEKWLQDNSQPSPQQNELRIYPNPVETGQVTLEMNTGEISEVRLINIAGKEVVLKKVDFGTTKFILSLENLPNGIYFVRVLSTEDKTVVKKLVVASR